MEFVDRARCKIWVYLTVPTASISNDFEDSKNQLYEKFPFSTITDAYGAWDDIFNTTFATSSWTETMIINLDNASNAHGFGLGTKSLQFVDTGILPSIFGEGIAIVRTVFVIILYTMALLTAYYVVIRAL